MDSLSFSIFGTGWYYRIDRYRIMACRRNFFLIGQDLMTGAAKYHRISWLCTGCGFGYYFDFCMWRCLNLLLGFKHFTADRTMASCCFSWFLTGCIFCFIVHDRMAGCRNFFFIRQDSLTAAAVYQGISRFFTGRYFGYYFYFCMSKTWNSLSWFQDFLAYRTVASACPSHGFTGWCDLCIGYFSVAGCRNLFVII